MLKQTNLSRVQSIYAKAIYKKRPKIKEKNVTSIFKSNNRSYQQVFFNYI